MAALGEASAVAIDRMLLHQVPFEVSQSFIVRFEGAFYLPLGHIPVYTGKLVSFQG